MFAKADASAYTEESIAASKAASYADKAEANGLGQGDSTSDATSDPGSDASGHGASESSGSGELGADGFDGSKPRTKGPVRSRWSNASLLRW